MSKDPMLFQIGVAEVKVLPGHVTAAVAHPRSGVLSLVEQTRAEVSVVDGALLTITLTQWEDGTRLLGAAELRRGNEEYARLVDGMRIGVQEATDGTWHMELTAVGMSAKGSVAAVCTDWAWMDTLTTVDTAIWLTELGALAVGTKAAVLLQESTRGHFLVASFLPRDVQVAFAGYAISRVLPIARFVAMGEYSAPRSDPAGSVVSRAQRSVVGKVAPPAASVSANSTGHAPTAEQSAVISHVAKDLDLAVEALAGTGKTTTLRLVAESVPDRSVQYIAFNRAIVDEARQKFPRNVASSTAHGLAMASVGHLHRHRLSFPRITNRDLAGWLSCSPFRFRHNDRDHVLTVDQVARYAIAGIRNFCKSIDEMPSEAHVPRPPLVMDNPEAMRALAAHLQPSMELIWRDLSAPDGNLRHGHDYYLKLWQLSRPHIPADLIMFDEAQDADPVMLTVVNDQSHAQLVYCGDDYQTLYEWRGAQNALELAHVDERLWLTQSFRFGPEIAEVANMFLNRLEAPHPIRGLHGMQSRVGTVTDPQAVLCRTNGAVIQSLVEAEASGRRAAVVGGIKDLEIFAGACEALIAGRRTSHPDLAPFQSWSEVTDWVDKNPEQAPDVAQRIRMVDRYGTELIRGLLGRAVDEAYADVTISTVHQAKGREWDTVRLASDFPHPDKMTVEELRVGYVAVTRGRTALDVGSLWDDIEPAWASPPSAQQHTLRPVRDRKRPAIGTPVNTGGRAAPGQPGAFR